MGHGCSMSRPVIRSADGSLSLVGRGPSVPPPWLVALTAGQGPPLPKIARQPWAAVPASHAPRTPTLLLPTVRTAMPPQQGCRAASAVGATRAALRPRTQQPLPRSWVGSQVLPAGAFSGALPASWGLVRSQPGRGIFAGRGAGPEALDPGRAEVSSEFLTPGRLLLDVPLESGGSLQVTAHDTKEKTAPAGTIPGSREEWRVLRFTPAEGTTNLVQSVTKVCVAPSGSEPREQLQRKVLPLAYTKSFPTIVLATLEVLGAPVLPAAAGEEQERLRILCIGLGGGSVPSFFTGGLKHCEVDVVELEPAVLRAATEATGFVRGPRLRAVVDDGAAFALSLAEAGGGPYHAVLVDAYDAAGDVPAELWSTGGRLAQALEKGLLCKRGGLVATNFLPHVDLHEPIAAYKSALASHNAGLGFSIQANVPDDERDQLSKLFEPDKGTGNRIAVQTCGGPPDLTLALLRERLPRAAAKVGEATSCAFKMEDLVTRGLRSWERG